MGFPEWTAQFSVWKTTGKDSFEAYAIACQNCAVYSVFASGMSSHIKIAQFNWACIPTFNELRKQSRKFRILINHRKPISNYMYLYIYYSKSLHFTHKVYLRVPCNLHKQRLFTYTVLIAWCLWWRNSMCHVMQQQNLYTNSIYFKALISHPLLSTP